MGRPAISGGASNENESMKNLFIDLGHSTKFQGAVGIKTEVLWTRTIWLKLKPMLDAKKWNIVLVPDSFGWKDLGLANRNLINRIAFINKTCKDGDWLISIHANGWNTPDANGVETCYMAGSNYMFEKAKSLSQTVSKHTGCRIRGNGAYPDDRKTASGRSRIAMVRDTRPPALLVECGFVTSKTDMDIPAEAYAQGIAEFVNGL